MSNEERPNNLARPGLYAALYDQADAVRAALGARWSWFTHLTPIGNFPSIIARGLEPRRPKGFPAPEVIDAFGPGALEIVCLHPEGAEVRPHSSEAGGRMQLAVAASDLPRRVSLDWSYCAEIAAQRWLDRGDRGVAQVAVGIGQSLGSVASYDPIEPHHLRVRLESSGSDPSTWPRLLDANVHELLVLPAPLEIDPFATDLPPAGG